MDSHLLGVEDLTVKFGGLTAVNSLSFTVESGTVVTLMGPNGAGKTTAFNGICGFTHATSGRVFFDRQDIRGLTPTVIASLGIRRTFQNNGLCPRMSALENVLLGMHLKIKNSSIGCALGLPGAIREEKQATKDALAILDELGVGDVAEREVGQLSFGRQRLVEIGRSIAGGARLLMLDEPAVGLTAEDRDVLARVLLDLVSDNKVSVLMVEHVQDLVNAVSDKVVVMDLGEKIAEGRPEDVRSNDRVLGAYLGSR